MLGYEANHKFTPEEWHEMKNDGEDHASRAASTDVESQLAGSSYAKMGKKWQYDAQALGSKPLSIIEGQSGREFCGL